MIDGKINPSKFACSRIDVVGFIVQGLELKVYNSGFGA
jgi:hypothetical protein